MNSQQERTVRSWLAARDPGNAPPRLRAAASAVPATTRGPIAPALDAAISRVFSLSRSAWLAVVLLAVVAVALTVAGAALWRSMQPFPPHGLIAYTIPLASTGGTGIHLVAADGSGERAVSAGASNVFDHSPRWSADGRTLLFARTTELDALSACGGVGSIVLYDVATATERVLATGLRPLDVVEWTPAGDRIAFLWPPSGCNAPGELGFVDVAGGQVTASPLDEGTWRLERIGAGISAVRKAVEQPGLPGEPPVTRWEVSSSDGAFVATLTGPRLDAGSHLDVSERGTGATVGLGPAGSPTWSPDSRALAFIQIVDRLPEHGVEYRHHLAVATADGWKVRTLGDVLTPGDGSPYDGVLSLFPLFWTADGRAIYWMDTKGGHVVDVIGGAVLDLPAVINGCEDLQWQPPGSA